MKTAREVYYDIHDVVQRRIVQQVEDACYFYRGDPVVMIWNDGKTVTIQVRTDQGTQRDYRVLPNSEWVD